MPAFYFSPCLCSILFIPWYQSMRAFGSQQCSSGLSSRVLTPLRVRLVMRKDIPQWGQEQWHKASFWEKILILICLSKPQSVCPKQKGKMWLWSLVTVLSVSIQCKVTFQKFRLCGYTALFCSQHLLGFSQPKVLCFFSRSESVVMLLG